MNRSLWGIEEIAAHTGRTTTTVRAWRVAGDLPAVVSGGPGSRLLWEESQIRTWWTDRTELLSLTGAAAVLGISKRTAGRWRKAGTFPDPDEMRGSNARWRKGTLTQWLATRPQPQPAPQPAPKQKAVTSWTAGDATRLGLSTSDLDALTSQIGEGPWPPQTVRSWWRQRRHQLMADPQVLFSRDVAHITGLSWDTVRTYRRKSLMPEPDGMHRNHPWWRQDTIIEWATQRAGRGRPRSS